MRSIVFFLLLTSSAFSFDWHTDVSSGNFTSESHLGDSSNVSKEGGNVGSIQNGNWIAYQDFDFGGGVAYLWIEAATPGSGGTIELRLGSDSGTLIGSVAITNTGDWNTYKPFALKIATPVTGIQNLYLKFVGGSGTLFKIAKFRFQRLAPDYKPIEPIVDWNFPVLAADMKSMLAFNTESHPTDDANVRREFGRLAYIKNGNWISYSNFDFGTGVNYFSVLGGSPGAGGNVEVRLGSATGTLVGTAAITTTGGYDNFRTFATSLTQTVTGVHDLYLKFTGGGGFLFDLGSFRFSKAGSVAKSYGRNVAADQLVQESNPGSAPVIPNNGQLGSLSNGSWVSYGSFDFGTDSDLITIEAATPGKGGVVEVRTGSETGPVVATVDVTYTGSWTHFRPYSSALSPKLSGTQDLYFKFMDPYNTGGNLFNLNSFAVGRKVSESAAPAEGSVYVYPSVPGLAPSPYYTYSVQRVSALDNAQKHLATNWLSPFAWFTDCPEPGSDRSLANTAYFDEYVGGWSHTYCNFELDRNTPIVVKITRNTVSGVPSGPIFMANVHPAHKVISCEIIDGDVYVTMKEPALVTVDIDGQMDNRDAPRAVRDVWNGSTAPYKSKQKGSHAVSIFANPVIPDKPAELNDPTVRYIEPGDPLPLPDDQAWTTLYFKPGIHNLSQDASGLERAWVKADRYPLRSNKNYYLPGNAIVFGNFYGSSNPNENIRIFGHGSISGYKIPHFYDYTGPEGPNGPGNFYHHTINIGNAINCNVEGITIADPPEHTIYLQNNHLSHIVSNSMRWYKSLAWRVNNDTGSAQGVMEDCFFRHQDDGPYFGAGQVIRRCTFWSDVNGQAFRGSFAMRDNVPEVTTMFPREIVFEDCDIIYARGMFMFTGGSNGIIGNNDGASNSLYSDGTPNTGQHLVFRNFRVTDPRPVRTLFGFNFSSSDPSFIGMNGVRLQNMEYRHPQTWGWPNMLAPTEGGIKNWYFDQVSIDGQTLNSSLLADRSVFETSNVSEIVFGESSVSPSSFNLVANATGASVMFDPPGGFYPLGTVVTVTAVPNVGNVFSNWGGDLSGSTNPTTITITANRSITANIEYPVLPRNGWVAGASPGNSGAGNAIDGNIATRWSTGTNQTNGQWFRVDMGGPRTFNRIVLDGGSSAGDFPRGYQVHVSNDALNWGSPIASGVGSNGVTMIDFAQQTAQHIRVTQTGSVSSTIWWSIHEFNVYGPVYTLTETSPSGSVLFDPPGPVHFAGTVVTATAVPDSGYVFNGWSGDVSGTTNPTTVTMIGDTSVTANFAPATYTLTTIAPNGSITLDPPGGIYAPGTLVTLTPTPAAGFQFQSWSGDLSGNENPATVTMDATKSVTANFWQPTGMTIDTTGGTTVLNYNAPQNNYIGNGTLQVSKAGGGSITLGTGAGVANTVFAMTGGLITIDSGVTLQNGGWSKGIWTNNQADMEVNGTLDLWDGNPVYINALSGAGSIAYGSPSGTGVRELFIGVNDGGGTFFGTIADTQFAGQILRIVKNGAGTQVFNNLANQKPKEIVINGGAVDLNATSNATFAADISGAGNLIKSGAGVLTLTGSLIQTGSISISEGTLSFGTNLAPTANLSVSTGATLNLNFPGQSTVNSLAVGGSGPLPPGIYGSSHVTHGSYFTGTGSLLILGLDYGAWAAANSGGQPFELDHDMDGIPNGVEYLMGQTGSSFTATPAIINTNGILSWTWPYDPTARATFKFQLSENLVDWTTEVSLPDPSLQVIAPVSPATRGSVKLTLTTGTQKRYARLVVTPTSVP
jgi:uncharacterized repeat protein (TIGR02543 family)